jgi:hypothetical protein
VRTRTLLKKSLQCVALFLVSHLIVACHDAMPLVE